MTDQPGTFTSISVTHEMRGKLRNLKEEGQTYSDLLQSMISQKDPTKEG